MFPYYGRGNVNASVVPERRVVLRMTGRVGLT